MTIPEVSDSGKKCRYASRVSASFAPPIPNRMAITFALAAPSCQPIAQGCPRRVVRLKQGPAGGPPILDFCVLTHHDAHMRTTIVINDALLKELRAIAARDRRPFRAVLEETLQRGLAARRPRDRRGVRIKPLPLGVRPAVLGTSLNQVYDQLEIDSDRNAS